MSRSNSPSYSLHQVRCPRLISLSVMRARHLPITCSPTLPFALNFNFWQVQCHCMVHKHNHTHVWDTIAIGEFNDNCTMGGE